MVAARRLGLAIVVGVLAGLSSAAFLVALEHVTELRLDHGWLVWLLPAGGLAIGLVAHHLGGRSAGGTALILDEIHEPTAWVPRRMAPLVLGGTLVTHLVGGSAGREGTAIQMSGSLTDAFGRALRVGPDDRRILLVAALAGGFGAVFGVPFAGWVFGLEVGATWRRRHGGAVLPALVAPFVGDRVVRLLGVHHTPLPRLRSVDLDPGLVARLALAGLAFGVGAAVFHGANRLVRRLAERTLRWPPARPLAGGLVLLALVELTGTREHLGLSLPLLTGAVAGGAGVASSAFAGKLAFTAVTLGTGFPGGEVTPLFVFGSTLGVAVARVLDAPVALLASVGMVAVFGAAANAPVACTVMAVELFGWAALVPAALVCVVARLASTRHSIYGLRGTSGRDGGRKRP